MPDKDLYGILGVSKSASSDEIKAAFRSKAKELHPDVHQGEEAKKHAEERFKELGEAYKILGDPGTRQKYDDYGYDGIRNRGGFSGSQADFGDMFGDISDIFGDFFGFDIAGGRGRGSSRRRRSGEDIRFDATLTFEEIAAGKTDTIEVPRKEACDTCKGSGLKPGTSREKCKTCGGAGKVRQSSGFFSVVTTCPRCGGAGEVAEHSCDDCGGSGVRIKKRKIEVKIPAGVESGSYLKLSGEGNMGSNGGPSGDLYVVINMRPHEIYRREGEDVLLDLPITTAQAVLGDDVEIPTLYGNYKLKVPAGTQTSDVLEIKGRGFQALHSQSKGDMRVIMRVETPRSANSKLKEAFKNVKVLESDENYVEVKKAQRAFKKYKKEEK